jgi:hypothetical protein
MHYRHGELRMSIDTELQHNQSSGRVAEIATSALAKVSALGAFAAGGAVIAFAVGSLYFRSYLVSIGASWVQPMISSASLLRVGGMLSAAVVVISTFLLGLVGHGTLKPKMVDRLHNVFAVLGTLCLGAIALMSSKAQPHLVSYLSLASIMIWTVVAGVAVALIVTRIASDGLHQMPMRAVILTIFTLPIALYVPMLVGGQEAREDMDSARTRLAVATSKAFPSGEWRLVLLEGDRALLVKLSDQPEARTFRMVDTKDIDTIEAQRAGPNFGSHK